MNQAQYNKLFSFLWNIANDVLVHAFNKGDYKDIIMPMLVLRRFDVLLEPTKKKVLEQKAQLDKMNLNTSQDRILCMASGFPFYNTSQFTLKSVINETDPQRLKSNFIDYINGYSNDVIDILDKFRLRQQVDNLTETGRLGSLISKFVDSNINLSINPVLDDEGNEILPALDNHTMGTIFEELLRKFNEENNVTEAGEHFTPRDYVKLLADLAVLPIKDKLEDGTPYGIYDGACGTGGILSIAQERLKELLPKSTIRLYGQELQANTYATCKADMMISGDLQDTNYQRKGNLRQYIAFGSTISNDGHPGEDFDFCISNPPFGTPWKEDLNAKGLTDKEKKKFTDSRFCYGYDGAISFLPDIGDCQMLFLANNVSRMRNNDLGTRIVEIHNGSSLFTGKAGGGESNLRRYIIEKDLLEAIIALPEKMFYNTGIGTYVWIVTNRKAPHRSGKVQLINATEFKTPLRKNLGEKNCELSEEDRKRILDLLINFEETPESKIFNNEEFGYWEVPVLRPKRDKDGNLIYKKSRKKDAAPEVEYAKNRNESERVPLTYPGGIEAFFENEVAPYDPAARFGTPEIGYELSFTKYFYKPVELRPLEDIRADIRDIEARTAGMLDQILS